MKYEAIKYEAYLGSTWVDLTPDVLGTVRGSMGIAGTSPLDRIASTGRLYFTLNNVNNKYTPGHKNCNSDFAVGMKIRLRITNGVTAYTRFYGTVGLNGIEVISTPWSGRTYLTVSDFIEKLAIHEMDLPTFAENKKIEEITALVLANMPSAPLSTEYNTGTTTFETVFDTVKAKTRALQELAKVALSELGYIYVKQSTASDEILTVEGRFTRAAATMATVQGNPASFDNSMKELQVTHGDNYYNSIKTISYPRRVDDTDTVLFELQWPVAVSPGEVRKITGRYIDPNQEAISVSGIDMQTPTATTDYLFNSLSDGSGTDKTTDLTVTATYGTNGIDYELENTSANIGYVTKLQARGKGVYTYRPVEHSENYAAGITADGKNTLTIDMLYQGDPLIAADFADVILDLYTQKRTQLNKIKMVANRSEFLKAAFLELQIGDKINVKADAVTIDADHFINSIAFEIKAGGLVTYTYGLLNADFAPTGDYWQLGDSENALSPYNDFSILETSTVLGF